MYCIGLNKYCLRLIRLGRRHVLALLPWDILPLLGVVLVK